MSGVVACTGCGGAVPDVQGPTHAYVPSSPGCWQVYNRMLEREYAEFGYPAIHRLTVDAYMAQHADGMESDRRQRQSVAAHLCCLHLVHEKGVSLEAAGLALAEMVRQRPVWPLLTAPSRPASVTVVDVAGATTLAEHTRRVEGWARSVWESWTPSHGVIADLVSHLAPASRTQR